MQKEKLLGDVVCADDVASAMLLSGPIKIDCNM